MAFFDALFGKKDKSVVGIDIGSSSLKVVQLRKQGGKAVLETYGELALGPYAGAEVGQATNLPSDRIAENLKDLMREAKVTSKDCGVSIPYARSLLTLVELPYRKDPKEQKTIVELEARKYIPVPFTEVQLDWFVVPDADLSAGKEKEKVNVLLVAVHNNELTLLQDVIKKADLLATFYEIEIFSTIRAVVDEPVRPVMVLDIGAGSTKIYIVERGVVITSHAIAVGSQDITRAIAASGNLPLARAEMFKKEQGLGGATESQEIVFGRIFNEAKKVILQYETGRKQAVSGIVLTGGGAVTKELDTYAKNAFSIDVRVADPFAKTEAPAFMRPVLEEIGPEFAVAMGIAMRKLEQE